MTKRQAEKMVVRAAVALCNAGKGFCFDITGKISDTMIGRRLEHAVGRYTRLAKMRGKK